MTTETDIMTTTAATAHATEAEPRITPLHVAVVWSADGPRLLTLAPSRGALLERVAQYVAAQAPDRLLPDDADAVAEHLRAGDHERAADHYFGTAGRRWDEEHLYLYVVESAGTAEHPVPADGRAT